MRPYFLRGGRLMLTVADGGGGGGGGGGGRNGQKLADEICE